jgi:YqaJ-like viral recombinase domain
MLVVECEQRAPEWFAARLGIPTASEFGRILTPTGLVSKQADGYLYELLAEWLTGKPHEGFSGRDWIERGRLLEAEARSWYQLVSDTEVRQVGFVYEDGRKLVGASPDGLIGTTGGLEIKCPLAHTHVKYLISTELPSEYIPQVQGGMMVTGAEWWDWLSYHPDMPPVKIRVRRDTEYIDRLNVQLAIFLSALGDKKAELLRKGLVPQPYVFPPAEEEAA